MTTVRLLGTEVADHKSLIGVEFNPKAPICSPGHFAVTLVERSLPLESRVKIEEEERILQLWLARIRCSIIILNKIHQTGTNALL